jgi:hypothetical protein
MAPGFAALGTAGATGGGFATGAAAPGEASVFACCAGALKGIATDFTAVDFTAVDFTAVGLLTGVPPLTAVVIADKGPGVTSMSVTVDG